ncbi:hypothetical protein CRG98_043246 [Punica granatum]|uniref:Uncharacterized protein n=1 Tax=Punica granatum TaxID=22663 RepID=A0A2I0HXD7_PUNGR|nr:hypothetical protein CRG98_043246 [Punica granatum]
MQKAVPYRPQLPPAAAACESSGPQALAAGDGHEGKFNGTKVNIQRMVMENPVIVFGRHGCCMCHVVTRLLLGLGVNPTLPDRLMLIVLQRHKQAIHVRVEERSRSWLFTAVYGSPNTTIREDLWGFLCSAAPAGDDGWLLMGDFNAIALEVEKSGGAPFNPNEASKFNEALHRCGLLDMGSIGPSSIIKLLYPLSLYICADP